MRKAKSLELGFNFKWVGLFCYSRFNSRETSIIQKVGEMIIGLEEPSPPPVFILSCGRAGSTLLRYIIDTHPSFCCPPELSLGFLCQRLYHTHYFTTGQICNDSDEAEKRRIVLAEVRRAISNIMRSYSAAKNKQMWCEKSPDNLVFLDCLLEVFPDAKYICLHRHCMDVVYSLLEVNRYGFIGDIAHYIHRNTKSLVAAFAEYWSDNAETLLKLEREHPSQCFRIKYESLVSSPSEILEQLFSFLGVSWDDDLLNKIFSVHHDSGHGDSKIWFAEDIYKTSVGKGLAIKHTHLGDMLERVNRLLDQAGYPMIGPDWGDASPASVQADAAMSATVDSHNVMEIFIGQLPHRLNERKDKLQGIRAACKFVVSGAANGIWMINLDGGDYRVAAQDGGADCTITVSASDLVEMATGKLNPAEAFFQERVYIKGDLNIARVVGEALFGVSI